MVVKMMRWRPWLASTGSMKYEVRVCVKRLEGADRVLGWVGEESDGVKLAVEIRWKRQRVGLSSLRRSVNRSLTKEVGLGENGVVSWDEEFHSVCGLSGCKDNVFQPWEICFNLLNGTNQGPKGRSSMLGTGSLNLAEYTDMAGRSHFELSVPLKLINGGAETCPSLSISMRLLELRLIQESPESVQKSVVPLSSQSPSGQTPSVEKDELSALKAGLRKVRILTSYVSSMRTKKACHEEDSSEGRCTIGSEDAECTYPFDSDSCDELEEGEYDEAKEENIVRNSFSYGTLAYANCVGSSYYSTKKASGEDEEWIYFSHRKSDVGYSTKEDSLAEQCESYVPPRKHIFLPWKRRKLNLKSPKAKGEPLLKEACREEGGDDIDYDRRQLSSNESLYLGSITNGFSVSEFGDDHFAIGSWEQKDIISRDGLMKLQTQVFFASIDQRSEQAAGESATIQRLRNLELRISQMERSPRFNEVDMESPAAKSAVEKVIVGQSCMRHSRKFSVESSNSLLGYGGQSLSNFPGESPRFGSSFKKMDYVVHPNESDARTMDNLSEVGDFMKDRVYTVDPVYNGGPCATPRESVNLDEVEDPEIKKLYIRLQVLEAERESMRLTLISMSNDKAQSMLLKEIAQQLCKDMTPKRHMLVKKPSFFHVFPIFTVVKWVASTVLWRKSQSQCKYMFELTANMGLLMLLDQGPRAKTWRSLTRPLV